VSDTTPAPTTLSDIREALAATLLTPAEAEEQALTRIAKVNGQLQAIVSFGSWGPAEADRHGDLRGVCVGVKDVIDVAGLPTLGGSPARTGVPPATQDADIVVRLRSAGASVIAKTVTTELATMDPAPTRNPWHPEATPGGSSSGSAASVAAGLLPLAIGTQTAGSLCRPAAYCGVSALKPTYGALPTAGVLPLAPSFDTLGLFTRRVADLAQGYAALKPLGDRGSARVATPATIGVISESGYPDASPEAVAELRRATSVLTELGYATESIPPLPQRDLLLLHHRTVMAFEAWSAHGDAFEQAPRKFGPAISDLLRTGSAVTAKEWQRSLDFLRVQRERYWEGLRGIQAVLTLPVPGPAPHRSTTGPADYLIGWTAFHGPLVVVPSALSSSGLPLATMIAAAPGADQQALQTATALASVTDTLPSNAPLTPR
jgi:Asp-tRNA(Asn)/Glu-tRNA(Gln) amidotransferase A subunit family amidase